ncbi:MAG: hypothetical protein FJ291_22705 [Planctomycetes bacterium]|nr:hypothetical protein [Planctomycetota bacterium]
MEEWLVKAPTNKLREFLRGRFQGIGPYAADSATREAELPPDLPLALWKEADDALESRLVQATVGLLEEIPGPGWTSDAIEWLCFFIDLADIKDVRVKDTLIAIARRGLWLKGTDDGPRCHVALLRTLLDMNWAEEREFWLHLPEAVKERFPGIVFRGLLTLGELDAAFSYLPEGIRNQKHAQQIIDVLADVMDDADRRRQVLEQLRYALPQLSRAASAHLAKWFRIFGWGDLAASASEPAPLPSRLPRPAIAGAGLKPEWALSA